MLLVKIERLLLNEIFITCGPVPYRTVPCRTVPKYILTGGPFCSVRSQARNPRSSFKQRVCSGQPCYEWFVIWPESESHEAYELPPRKGVGACAPCVSFSPDIATFTHAETLDYLSYSRGTRNEHLNCPSTAVAGEVGKGGHNYPPRT